MLPVPVLLGLAGGMRTFVPPAALALDGRVAGRPRALLLVASAVELVADQHPQMRSRLEPGGLIARAVASGASAGTLAGPSAVPVAAAVALASAQVCARTRAALTARTGAARRWAVAEDLLALTLAFAALRGAARSAVPSQRPPSPA